MSEPPAAESRPVVIVGGGWAGLAAAVELCIAGAPLVLVESARQLGGRARGVRYGERVVDNGQHLLTGACQRLLMLMRSVGVNPDETLLRIPFRLTLRNNTGNCLVLKTPNLPAPLHLMAALITTSGLGIGDRMCALRFGLRIASTRIQAGQDISVQALLHSNRQTPALIAKLWEPLCISALNTPVAEASAHLFLNVLRETFAHLNAHSDLLVPRTCLTELLPQPAMEFLERHGTRVLLGQRVTGVETNGKRVSAVRVNGRSIPASDIILATPHPIARRLMSPHPQLRLICNNLAQLGHEPVTTLYLDYPPETRLEQPLVGLQGGTAQWIFDRRVCGQPGLMAVVISARGPHTGWSNGQLGATVIKEIARCFPYWPRPSGQLLIREKRATFSARAGIDLLRPASRTPLQGLWLAGDYTDNDLPATLEAAVRSGGDCARQLLARLPKAESVV